MNRAEPSSATLAGPRDSEAVVPAPDAITADSPVRAVLLQTAFERVRLSLLMTVTVCLVFVGLLWPFFPPHGMLQWGFVLLAVAALRYTMAWMFARADPQADELARWERWFTAGALAGGASWAMGPVLLMPGAEGSQQYLLVLTLLAVSAVSMSALVSQVTAMFAFQVAALLPTAVVLWATSRGDVQSLAAAIVFAALVSLMLVGRASSQSTRKLVAAEWRLSHAVVQAQAASSAKTRFLANMSHELRTPLNAVIGAAQLLKVSDDKPEQRAELVQAIQRSGTNLLGLIDNILDLSRIEVGALSLDSADFHLPDCVDAAMVSAGLAARSKGLALSAVVAPDLAAWRRGDAARLRQLLLNLLGNAVKFTKQGQVVLRVGAGSGADEVCFSVSDTGVGIDPLALPHVFDAFRQADENTHRQFGGSGLGLAIVRQIVQAMGGRISVSSQLGQGSCFEMAMPLPAVPELTKPGAAHEAPLPADLAPMPSLSLNASDGPAAPDATQVLVVEDDALNRTIVCRLLQHAGYQVSAVSDGSAALERLRSRPFDIVLMDWQMPGMDGLEATRRLRAGEAGERARSLPVVALTANAFGEDRAACLAAGMNDFLTKPVVVDALTTAIDRLVPRRAAAMQPALDGRP